MANHLTEAQMKQYFGWVQSSDMASTYVHLSGRDVDRDLLELNGIKSGEEDSEKFSMKICQRCKTNNSPDTRFCNSCGLPMDAKVGIQIDEMREKADRLMTELVRRPEVLNVLARAKIQSSNA